MTQAANFLNTTRSFFFEDLYEGMDAESSNIISDENIVLFSLLSGDINPIHLVLDSFKSNSRLDDDFLLSQVGTNDKLTQRFW